MASASETSFKTLLERDCPFLSGKISVSKVTSTYPDNSMGVEFLINFSGIAGDFNQYSLKPAADLAGVNIAYS